MYVKFKPSRIFFLLWINNEASDPVSENELKVNNFLNILCVHLFYIRNEISYISLGI